MFPNASDPESLFIRAFGEPSGDVEGVPTWVNVGESIGMWPFEDVEIGSLREEIERIQSSEGYLSNKNSMNTYGMDYLAVYLPYSFHGRSKWGIYYNEDAIDFLVSDIALEMMANAPQARLQFVAYLTWKGIRCHELFHHAIEWAAANWSIQTGRDCYRPSFRDTDVETLEESLATLLEIDSASRWRRDRDDDGVDSPTLRAFRSAWEKVPRPYPYSEWSTIRQAPLQAMNDLSRLMASIDAAQSIHDATRLLPPRPSMLRLPEYWNTGQNRVNAQHARFRRVPELKIVMKHARSVQKSGSPPSVFVNDRFNGNHPIRIERLGKRPVELSPKWNGLPHHVIPQLALLFDMDPPEYYKALDSVR